MRTLAFFSLSLALGAISLPACKQKKEVEAAKRSFEDFKTQVGKLQAAMPDLRARVKSLPEDLPGIEPVHSMLFSIEEVLGVEGARIEWLSGEMKAAFSSGNKEQIQKVSDEIRGAIQGGQGIEKAILKLKDQVVPFERMAAERRANVPK